MQRPLVDQKYKLEKIQGKGGWTYVLIAEVPPSKRARFGWVKVKGKIDDFELFSYRLMPMGNGMLFLPVRAEIRKKIKKKEGDWVHVTLYEDQTPLDVPQELLDCLQDEPRAYENFMALPEGAQKEYRDWVYAAKREQTKVDRIAKMIDMLLKGLRLTGSKYL
ncbi:YdeI/OmpD-associated family protein [Dyadobacter pollutisoli]|jgi:hypothetical protein|uniref:YdeI/OmpD-associated family protein n=1 Tax=Dyadobacter pollutisoli TaxID=2910158 RepID=A0A9E8SMN2_9BACT|nr:YdeI/OmpD-associated family protein [Dyadobacter pollutisoli]WAC12931.1 YdeI/OmpD-associated family protein [Dyadobacter pollutisoli]